MQYSISYTYCDQSDPTNCIQIHLGQGSGLWTACETQEEFEEQVYYRVSEWKEFTIGAKYLLPCLIDEMLSVEASVDRKTDPNHVNIDVKIVYENRDKSLA